jgi:serine/threonine-protein kinase HipA
MPNNERYIIPTIYGKEIGVIAEWEHGIKFQYNDLFDGHSLALSPIMMPYDPSRVYALYDAMPFNGLPGIFNDSLPDSFGARIMREFFIKRYGIEKKIPLLEKLLYVGRNGMGAIEYLPPMVDETTHIGMELREYIEGVKVLLSGSSSEVIERLTELPASPGGARPKAAIVWDRANNTMKVGNSNFNTSKNEEHWIIKFDEEGRETTKIEHTYMGMANEIGIETPKTELIHMNKEVHFAVKRFDKTDIGEKIHMATLSGLLHLRVDEQANGSYEQAMRTAFTFDGYEGVKQVFKRMLFNIVGKNCDDHAKNMAFLMDRNGKWKISPAYDLTYSNGLANFGQHRMTIAKKVNHITRNDVLKSVEEFSLEPSFILEAIESVNTLFSEVDKRLMANGVSKKSAIEIKNNIHFL